MENDVFFTSLFPSLSNEPKMRVIIQELSRKSHQFHYFGHELRAVATLIRRKPKKIIWSIKLRFLLGTPTHCQRWFGGSRKKLFGHELRFRGSITLPLPDLPLYWCQALFWERFGQFKDFGQILGIAGFSSFWEHFMTVWQTDKSTTWWNIFEK
jgi:hypothetical protein